MAETAQALSATANTEGPSSGISVVQSSRWAITGTAATVVSAVVRLFVVGVALDGAEFVDGLFLLTVIPTVATLFRLGLDRTGARLVGRAISLGDEEAAQGAFVAALRLALLLGLVGALPVALAPTYDISLGLFLTTTVDAVGRLSLSIWLASEIVRTILVEVARTRARFLSAFVADSGPRNFLFIGLMLALIVTSSASLRLTIIAACVANLVSMTGSLQLLPRALRPSRVTTDLASNRSRELLASSPALFATVSGAMLLASGDLWIVARYFDERAAAAYLIAFQIASIFALIMTVENAATSPYIARLGSLRAKRRTLSAILRLAATVGLTLAAGAYLLLAVGRLWLPADLGDVDVTLATHLALLLAAGQVASISCGPCGTVFVMSERPQIGAFFTVAVGLSVLAAELIVALNGASISTVAAISGGGVVLLNALLAIAARRSLGLTTVSTLNPRSLLNFSRIARAEIL